MTFVAFLRAVNLGKKQVKMAALKELLESLGYTNVQTFLASGNVIFDSKIPNEKTVQTKLEKELAKKFGFPIEIMLRKRTDLEKLIKRNPFKKIKASPETQLYITFKYTATSSNHPTPPDGITIIESNKQEILSTVDFKKGIGTTDLMNFLQKQFCKTITTRKWNTLEKIINA